MYYYHNEQNILNFSHHAQHTKFYSKLLTLLMHQFNIVFSYKITCFLQIKSILYLTFPYHSLSYLGLWGYFYLTFYVCAHCFIILISKFGDTLRGRIARNLKLFSALNAGIVPQVTCLDFI